MAKKKVEPIRAENVETTDTPVAAEEQESQPTVDEGEQTEGAGAAATAEAEAPQEASAPHLVRTLDRNGNCGNCGNPHVSRYGEGKWKCVCGAGNI